MFDRKNAQQSPSDTSDSPARPSAPAESRSAVSGATTRATIGPTIRIKGDVTGDENLHIDGKVEGTVALPEHELVVGKSGTVRADVTARLIRIDGEVQGDIVGSEKVIISATGNVRGNIVSPRMSLEDGAKFKGSIDMDPASGGSRNNPAKGSQAPASDPADSSGSSKASATGTSPSGEDKSASNAASNKKSANS